MNNISAYKQEIRETNTGTATWVAWDEFDSMGKTCPFRSVLKFQLCLFGELDRSIKVYDEH